MPPLQQSIDCPNPRCATPASLALCIRFARGFGLQLTPGGPHSARWDDVHCLVCGHFSSPYATAHQDGRDLSDDAGWLAAVDRALRQAKHGRLPQYLTEHDLGVFDLLSMRRGVQRLAVLERVATDGRAFPQIGLLRVAADAEVPEMFGLAHGEAESEPFARKVHVLGRLLGADATEPVPRYCACPDPNPAWFFYRDDRFVGLLHLEPNRSYRGTMTIDGCLQRLLHAV